MERNKFCILGRSEIWENILIQLGIPYDFYNHDKSLNLKKIYSAVILINRIPDEKLSFIRKLTGEKTIFIFTPSWGKINEKKKAEEKHIRQELEYHFDLKLKEYETDLKLDKRNLFFPIKLDELPVGKSQRRQFYHKRNELPSERVGIINFYEITRYVKNFLIEAFRSVNIELTGYTVLPDDKPLFIFRIDTDFADIAQIKDLYELCSRYGITATWFTDVKSDEILEYYKSFRDQEIGLHCDRHFVYDSKEENQANITRGLNRLIDHKISPAGFASPFGEWNTALEEVLLDNGFLYSSEFGFAWDALPWIRKHGERKILQIPIHPVSPGRLRRSHFSQGEMLDYYLSVIENNIASNIPAIIYHHPAHGMLGLIEEIFKYVKTEKMNNLTMHSYASWWLKRYESLHRESASELMTERKVEMEYHEYPEDHTRIYKKSWRWHLYNLESNRGKRYFKRYGYPVKKKSR